VIALTTCLFFGAPSPGLLTIESMCVQQEQGMLGMPFQILHPGRQAVLPPKSQVVIVRNSRGFTTIGFVT